MQSLVKGRVVAVFVILGILCSFGIVFAAEKSTERQPGYARVGNAGEQITLPPGVLPTEVSTSYDSSGKSAIQTTIMTEGFEEIWPSGLWEVGHWNSSIDAYWGNTSYRSHQGSWSAYCVDGGSQSVAPPGPYPNNVVSWMIWGPFSLSDATDCTVTCSFWLDTKLNSDPILLFYSVDGQNFQGIDGWWGYSDGWLPWKEHIPSAAYGASSVWIAYIFQSEESYSYEGAYIDDIIVAKQTNGGSSLSLTSPNGGEQWGIGSAQTIAWTSQGVSGNVKIEINRNYPSGTWDMLFASVSNDGSESWPVTSPASTTCRMRISSVSDPSIQDTSDDNFIVAATSLTLSSPNGGESWGIGSSHAITWWYANISGNIKIELSRNGGSTYPETLAASVPVSTGSYNWTVSGPASTTCRVKVTSIADASFSDTSNGDFIISALPSIAFAPLGFTFNCTLGQANPPPQTLEIWNSNGGSLNWTASEGAGLLSLVPTAGSSTGEHDPVTVAVDASGLAVGTYAATIHIVAAGADNSPQSVGVMLVVADLSTRTVTYALQANWNMISLLVVPTPANPSVIFGGLPPGWVIYAWDAANGRYIGKEQIVLGLTQGYWLKVSTAVEYSVSGQPNAAEQTEIDLGMGWNLIGVPYEGTIPWGAVRVSKDGGALVPLDQAIASNWIQAMFFRWQGSAYQGLTTGGIFQPLSGYWVKTKVTGVRLVFMQP